MIWGGGAKKRMDDLMMDCLRHKNHSLPPLRHTKLEDITRDDDFLQYFHSKGLSLKPDLRQSVETSKETHGEVLRKSLVEYLINSPVKNVSSIPQCLQSPTSKRISKRDRWSSRIQLHEEGSGEEVEDEVVAE